MTPSRPDEFRAPLSEVGQRRVLTVLAVLADVIHAVTLVYFWQQGSARATQAATSLVITLVLTGLALWPAFPLRRVQQIVVGLVCALLLLNLLSVYQTGRPITSGLLIHLVILALFAYTWLPPRVATAVLGVSYAALAGAAAASRMPDVPGVLLVGLTLPLVWYLTVHGREVSRERGRSEALRTLAYRDALTGVHNRRAGTERLSSLLDGPVAGGGEVGGGEVAAALFDLDHFKQINDTLGHQQGDRMLVAVADSLVASFGEGGTVVRWGGEEFLVILTGLTRAQARERVDGALDAVRELYLSGLPAMTISAGLAFATETRDPVALLDLADGRLYQAKAAGRNRAR
ncbi:diguanylate cyclase [Deinococcus sp. KSM4-11]|uniref:GGDEF domain-containing protein n=1 Tax=Deinococcus sp. KSM4-11 TaxID=2568654 RepID=UPI001454D97F|nr:GGDEF domain-containing protein [Deinococcus sp. KSM4-11]